MIAPSPQDLPSLLLHAATQESGRPAALNSLLADPRTHTAALRWLCLWQLLAGDLREASSAADRLRRLAPASKVPAALLWAIQLMEKLGGEQSRSLVQATLRLGEANIETRLLLELLLANGQGETAHSLLPSLGSIPPEAAIDLVGRTMKAVGGRSYGQVEVTKRGRAGGWLIGLRGRRDGPRVVVRQKSARSEILPTQVRRKDPAPSPLVGYRFDIDSQSYAGKPFDVALVEAAGEFVLAGSPVVVPAASSPSMEGEVWSVRRGVVKGWAHDASRPDKPVRILVRDDLGHAVTVIADQPSSVLSRAAIGDGKCAFAAVLPQSSARLHVEVLFERTAIPLRGSPFADADLPVAASPAQVDGAAPRPLVAPPSLGDDPLGTPDDSLARKAARLSDVVDVIIPVHGNESGSLACIAAVLGSARRRRFEIVVVDDDSPEPHLSASLDELARAGKILLLRNDQNLGFVRSVNRAMELHPDRDAVILNSDTLVAPGWLDRLAAAAAADERIGTATPLSNNATICSYPASDRANEMPAADDLRNLDRICAKVGAHEVVDIPTGVGFCLFIRRACWHDVGGFDAVRFGRGYGEENDFCMRARDRGWRNVLAAGVFVAHRGGASFGSESGVATVRAIGTLNALYPGYDRFIASWVKEDPLRPLRRKIDLERLASRPAERRVLMVTADVTGGTERHVREIGAELSRAGAEVLVVHPVGGLKSGPSGIAISSLMRNEFPNLLYGPDDSKLLIGDLKRLRIEYVHFHHLLGLPELAVDIPRRLGCVFDVTVHDYSWICKRINLIDESGRYCGEPDAPACDTCIRINGATDPSPLSTREIRERSRRIFAKARSVFVPSDDARERLSRYFPGVPFVVRYHEEESTRRASPVRRRAEAQAMRVAVVGAIGSHKGYEVLLGCARDAARRSLPIEFRVVGYTQDDGALIRTGHVWVTGRFEESEVDDLLEREACDAALLPSVWPETWCYTLSAVLRAGLLPFVFEVGAMAERLKRLGSGELLDLRLKPEQINDRLLDHWLSGDLSRRVTVSSGGPIDPPAKRGRRLSAPQKRIAENGGKPTNGWVGA